MIGHISLGASKILNVCKELNIEEDKKVKLLNIILSHHGCKEYGSPKDPATPEALLISLIDNLDAKLKRIIKIKNKANTEDDFFYNAEFGNIFLK
jgi:3'-5' exoribonuclease